MLILVYKVNKNLLFSFFMKKKSYLAISVCFLRNGLKCNFSFASKLSNISTKSKSQLTRAVCYEHQVTWKLSNLEAKR